VGQDPEHGEGVGHLYRIDATKQGDVSPQIADGDGYKDNDNSGQIWHVGGVDTDGSITGEENGLLYRRTISTVAVADGFVYAPDLSGFLHCVDFKTGEKKWVYDTFAAVWGSPMVVDGRVLLGDEDGEMVILKAGDKLEAIETKTFNSSIYSTPTIANGTMFVSDRSRLYAIKVK
jgi:outer membrane protein assembly factor BamB